MNRIMTKPKDKIKMTFYQEIATAIAKARDGGVTVPEILEAFKRNRRYDSQRKFGRHRYVSTTNRTAESEHLART
jgi:hypothetical protein